MRKKKEEKPDKRVIPNFFRAAEVDSSNIYYGVLISDNGFRFTSFSCHDGDSSHLKERSLDKCDFVFSKIDRDDFELHAKIAISRMKRDVFEQQLELDAITFKTEYSAKKFKELGFV